MQSLKIIDTWIATKSIPWTPKWRPSEIKNLLFAWSEHFSILERTFSSLKYLKFVHISKHRLMWTWNITIFAVQFVLQNDNLISWYKIDPSSNYWIPFEFLHHFLINIALPFPLILRFKSSPFLIHPMLWCLIGNWMMYFRLYSVPVCIDWNKMNIIIFQGRNEWRHFPDERMHYDASVLFGKLKYF